MKFRPGVVPQCPNNRGFTCSASSFSAQQRIGHQVNLADRQVVRRAPPRVDPGPVRLLQWAALDGALRGFGSAHQAGSSSGRYGDIREALCRRHPILSSGCLSRKGPKAHPLTRRLPTTDAGEPQLNELPDPLGPLAGVMGLLSGSATSSLSPLSSRASVHSTAGR